MKFLKYSKKPGFTVVELLVVIVVIGVLAAIALISYTGVSQKATIASIQSDLASGSSKLKMYSTDNSTYPTSMAYVGGKFCPTPVDVKYCFDASPGNSYEYSTSGSSPFITFVLTVHHTGVPDYRITESTSPQVYAVSSPYIFDTGGIFINSVGARTHTFDADETIIATKSGTISISISGAGSGGDGTDGGIDGPGGSGLPGGNSVLNNTTVNLIYTAYGAGNGTGADTPVGFSNTASPIVGGGAGGGAGGHSDWCSERNGANGSPGGRITGSINIVSGQVFHITIGNGGDGGGGAGLPNDCSDSGYDNGGPGSPGQVVISYSY